MFATAIELLAEGPNGGGAGSGGGDVLVLRGTFAGEAGGGVSRGLLGLRARFSA